MARTVDDLSPDRRRRPVGSVHACTLVAAIVGALALHPASALALGVAGSTMMDPSPRAVGMGGVVIAQEPTTADVPGMPRSAIATGAVDFIIPLDQIASRLGMLVVAEGVRA
jgi:hypothetical protein